MTISSIPLSELTRRLECLPCWTHDIARKALHRRLLFEDFSAALAAMVRIGVASEKVDHHPEWSNVYNVIDIWLTTHDASGVSERDFALASSINEMFPG